MNIWNIISQHSDFCLDSLPPAPLVLLHAIAAIINKNPNP